jgi:hypothetical protein
MLILTLENPPKLVGNNNGLFVNILIPGHLLTDIAWQKSYLPPAKAKIHGSCS